MHSLLAEPHDPDRPARDRLKAQGQGALSDAELLALFWGGNIQHLQIAREILDQYTLVELSRRNFEELLEIRGFTPRRAEAFMAGIGLGSRIWSRERTRSSRIRSSMDVYDRLAPSLRHRDREVFMTLLLDTRHQVLAEEVIAQGGITLISIHPREVFAPAVRRGAVSIICAHNHPSGDPSPSQDDLAITQRLVAAGETLGIQVLDHVIIGDGRYTSLADRGLMGSSS